MADELPAATAPRPFPVSPWRHPLHRPLPQAESERAPVLASKVLCEHGGANPRCSRRHDDGVWRKRLGFPCRFISPMLPRPVMCIPGRRMPRSRFIQSAPQHFPNKRFDRFQHPCHRGTLSPGWHHRPGPFGGEADRTSCPCPGCVGWRQWAASSRMGRRGPSASAFLQTLPTLPLRRRTYSLSVPVGRVSSVRRTI